MNQEKNSFVLEAKNLCFKRQAQIIFDQFNFALPPGGITAITGKSGLGKTTLLHLALGILAPTSGEICVSGKGLHHIAIKERSHLAGLIFQDFQLFPHLTCKENILLAPKIRGKDSLEKARGRIQFLLKRLDIEELADKYPHQLSGGQKQRASMARGLILEPKVMFMDEPSSGLDLSSTKNLAKLLGELSKEGQEIILVSHDLEFLQLCEAHQYELKKEKGKTALIKS